MHDGLFAMPLHTDIGCRILNWIVDWPDRPIWTVWSWEQREGDGKPKFNKYTACRYRSRSRIHLLQSTMAGKMGKWIGNSFQSHRRPRMQEPKYVIIIIYLLCERAASYRFYSLPSHFFPLLFGHYMTIILCYSLTLFLFFSYFAYLEISARYMRSFFVFLIAHSSRSTQQLPSVRWTGKNGLIESMKLKKKVDATGTMNG